MTPSTHRPRLSGSTECQGQALPGQLLAGAQAGVDLDQQLLKSALSMRVSGSSSANGVGLFPPGEMPLVVHRLPAPCPPTDWGRISCTQTAFSAAVTLCKLAQRRLSLLGQEIGAPVAWQALATGGDAL